MAITDHGFQKLDMSSFTHHIEKLKALAAQRRGQEEYEAKSEYHIKTHLISQLEILRSMITSITMLMVYSASQFLFAVNAKVVGSSPGHPNHQHRHQLCVNDVRYLDDGLID